jgi:hypothetical protein
MGDARRTTEQVSRVVGPHVSSRPSRRPPEVPRVVLHARPLPPADGERWVEAFNEDLS